MLLRRSIVFLFFLFPSWVATGQVRRMEPAHVCKHHCIHQKTSLRSPGIYEQDVRVHDYDVKFYGLDLEVVPWSTFISGSVRILSQIVAPDTRYFVLELMNDLVVSRVERDHQNLLFNHTNSNLVIDLGEAETVGAMVDLVVYYSGEPKPEGFFAGIQSLSNNFGDKVLFTLSEPHNARQWFPCKQVLEDKADSVYVILTTPPGIKAASNGLLAGITELPDGRLRHEWKSYYPIAYYLVSMAVANYQEYNFYAPLSDENDSVFVQNFIYNYPQVLQQLKPEIDRTKPMMELMSRLWGDYPFAAEKYGHAQAPMGGGMEHQTISTMGYFGFDITAHELAHHWFGNNVTCATWSDIWINEGFASYAEYLAREFILGSESAQQWMQSAHQNIKSQPGGSVYIPAIQLTDVWRIFNGRLSYKKGAAILHQLRFEINDDELFFFIMEDFQNRFADGVATGDDFMRVVELHTDSNWEWFFEQWYYGEGFPVYELKWWQKDGKLHIRSSQNTSSAFTSFFAGTLEFEIVTQQKIHTIRVFQTDILQEFEIELDEKVQQVIFDPRRYMLKNFTLWDSTQVDTPQLPQINVFPNPFADFFEVDYPESWHNSELVIFDMHGRVIHQERLLPETRMQHVTSLAAGMYLVKISSMAGENKTFVVIKN